MIDSSVVAASIFRSFPQVIFGFSMRNGGVSPSPYGLNMSLAVGDDPMNVIENQKRFLALLGIQPERLAIPKQVHGDRVVTVVSPGTYERCDALVTRVEEIYLRVTAADCLPIFFLDPDTPAVAAIHAGWRGCAKSIVEKTIVHMMRECSTKPETLRIYIGPSARLCCYEVGDEVAVQFDRRFLMKNGKQRLHLDMVGLARSHLRRCGIDNSNIEIAPHCTICTPQLFHSHRRDGAKSGRMMGVIGLKPY